MEKLGSAWPSESGAPEALLRLLEYGERVRGPVVGDFRAGTALQQDLYRWFQGDRKMARQFGIFGIDGGHSLYGFWFYPGVAPEKAPVVCLRGGGTGSAVLASGIEPFLSLLAAGTGRVSDLLTGGAEAAGEVPGLHAFRAWLKKELRLSPPRDAAALVRQAQAAHPDLEVVVTEWSEKNATLEGPSAEGWPPSRRR